MFPVTEPTTPAKKEKGSVIFKKKIPAGGGGKKLSKETNFHTGRGPQPKGGEKGVVPQGKLNPNFREKGRRGGT